jgi:hypothetical protein
VTLSPADRLTALRKQLLRIVLLAELIAADPDASWPTRGG